MKAKNINPGYGRFQKVPASASGVSAAGMEKIRQVVKLYIPMTFIYRA
jgi:hypothetical protein